MKISLRKVENNKEELDKILTVLCRGQGLPWQSDGRHALHDRPVSDLYSKCMHIESACMQICTAHACKDVKYSTTLPNPLLICAHQES